MARIYSPDQNQFEGSFSPSAASRGFATETAVDYSRLESARAKQANDDQATRSRALARQATLDQGMLQGKQTINSARQAISQSKQSASLSLLKGLTSLSVSAADALEGVYEQQQLVQQQDDTISAAFGITEAAEQGQIDPASQRAIDHEFENVAHANATEEAVESVTTDPNTAEALRHQNNQNITIQQVQRGNAYAAAGEFGSFHTSYVNNPDRVFTRPDGSTFTRGTIRDASDIALIDSSARAAFYTAAGVAGMPRAQVATTLAPVVVNTGNSFRTQANAQLIAGRTASRVDDARISTENALAADESMEMVFQQGSSALFSSGAYVGNRGKANEDTIKTILNWAIRSNRPDVIEELARTTKVPGNPGTALGRQYDALFEAAREGVINESLSDNQRERAVAEDTIVMGERTRNLALATAQTPEEERQINLAAADEYEATGTPEGRLRAEQLRANPNYSQFTALDLQQQQDQGVQFSNEELGELVSNGEITGKEAQGLGWSPNNELSADGVASQRAEDFASETRAQGQAAVNAALQAGKGGTNAAMSAQDRQILMQGSGKSIINDVGDRINREVAVLIRSNPDISDADVRSFIQRRGQEIAGEVTVDQEGQLSYTFGGVERGRSTPIAEVVPTLPMQNSGNANNIAHDFRGFSATDLSSRGDVAITSDLILNEREAFIARDAIQRGVPLPKTIGDKAAALGTNAETLLRAQLELLGQDYPTPPARSTNPNLTSRGRATSGQYDTGEVIGGVQLDTLRNAVVGKESGNNYQAVNPHSGALGYGQVMPENVGPWSQEVLGYRISQREFLRNPGLQMQIINGRFRKMMQQQEAAGYSGDVLLRRVASIWYSGQGNLYNSMRPESYNGHSYPSIGSYTLDVLARYRG